MCISYVLFNTLLLIPTSGVWASSHWHDCRLSTPSHTSNFPLFPYLHVLTFPLSVSVCYAFECVELDIAMDMLILILASIVFPLF